MSKFKYLRKFSRFEKNEMITEEISAQGWVRMAMEALPLLMGGGVYGQQQTGQQQGTISLQKAFQTKGNPNFSRYDILISRSNAPAKDKFGSISREEASNYMWLTDSKGKPVEVLLQNFPTAVSPTKWTRYLKGKKSDILKAINGTGPMLENFTFITQAQAKADGMTDTKNFNGADVADYVRVGNMKIDGEGAGTFNLEGADEDVVIGGNGVWVLMRLINEGRKQTNKSTLCRFEMGLIKGEASGFEQIQQATVVVSTLKEHQMKTLNYILEMSIANFNKMLVQGVKQDGTWAENGTQKPLFRQALGNLFDISGGKTVADLKGASDKELASAFAKTFNFYLTDFQPRGTDGKPLELGIEGYKVLDESKAMDFVNRFKETKTDKERDAIMDEVIKTFKEIYLENFQIFTNGFLGDSIDTKDFASKIMNAVWNYKEFDQGVRLHVFDTKLTREGQKSSTKSVTRVIDKEGKAGSLDIDSEQKGTGGNKYNVDKKIGESLRHVKKFKFFK